MLYRKDQANSEIPFVTNLVYLSDGIVKQIEFGGKLVEHKSVFRPGQTNAILATTWFVGTNKIAFPDEFRFRRFSHPESTNVPPKFLRSQTAGKVTNYLNYCGPEELLPPIEGSQRILDKRFKFTNYPSAPFTYEASNAWPLEATASNVHALRQKAVPAVQHESKKQSKMTFILLAGAGSLLVLVPLLFRSVYRGRTKKTPSSPER
jgi:hypothetical protein